MPIMPFANWLQVRHYCETHAYIYYQAPLDTHHSTCAVVRVFKNGKVRIVAPSGYRFTIDAEHMSRLSHNA